jgi:hypothetical protein
MWYRFHITVVEQTMPRESRSKRVIQVPIDQGLLSKIDDSARLVAESRAAFIREACKLRVRQLDLARLDRRYEEGYRRKPESSGWAKTSAVLLTRVLSREKW